MIRPQLTTAELELENTFCNRLAGNPAFATQGARLQLLDMMLRLFVLGDMNKKLPPLDTRPLKPFVRRMKQLLDTPDAQRGFLEQMLSDLLPPEMPAIHRVLIDHVFQSLFDAEERNTGSSRHG